MGQALYRKYRTRTLRETIGQEHITRTLEQGLKQGRISHAYLLTGPRGVGKTSVARILAHAINDLPYEDDSPHIDIIEIDAASNRRIDEIRELRDKIYVAPVSAKYKVYIIDEVHMLTKEAFNALLKTLEEPPAHVVFILATTDAHKLPGTIISRTQRFTFKPVDTDKVVARLAEIAEQEKLDITTDALQLLAEHGEGSFRDSISLLDQLTSRSGRVDVGEVQDLLGIPPVEAIDGLITSLNGAGGTAQLITALDGLLAQGYQPAGIAKQLGLRLRGQLIDDRQRSLPTDIILELLERLIEVPVSHDPVHFLEITLIGALPDRPSASHNSSISSTSHSDDEPAESAVPTSKADAAEPEATKPQVKPPAGSEPFDETIWPKVLKTLKKHHNTLYGVVRMAQPSFPGEDTLRLTFAFAFHQKRLKETANSRKLADVIYGLTGKGVKVECLLDKSVRPPETKPDTDLNAISNIFGTAELLES